MPARFDTAVSSTLLGAAAAVALTVAACAPRQPAADAASAQRGKEVADRYCAVCHAVTPAQAPAIKSAGPGFAEIANRPGRNRANLTRFMSEWHELGKIDMPGVPMPTILLTAEQRADVISYILTMQLNQSTGNQPPIGLRPF